MTWNHWELVDTEDIVSPIDKLQLDKLTHDEPVGKVPTAYTACLVIGDDICQLTARQVKTHCVSISLVFKSTQLINHVKIINKQDKSADGVIKILERHLHRSQPECNSNAIAISISYTLVRKTPTKD